jgi:lipoate-protein ligase B
MHYLMQDIERYLMSCRELTAFCSQNGWIDTTSLYYEIIEQSDQHVIALVQFEEVLTQGGGSAAVRVACQGRLRLTLDRYGQVSYAELL